MMGNQVLLPRNMMGSMPMRPSNSLTMPSYWNRLRNTPPITAQERKYGRKKTVCAIRMNLWWTTSFSSRARISGTNRRRMILAIEMDSVLPTTFQNVGRASMSRKFFNPTQGEFLKLRRGGKILERHDQTEHGQVGKDNQESYAGNQH